jgi:sugar fermentation stimulation protein A
MSKGFSSRGEEVNLGVKIGGPLKEAEFLLRPNRFLARVKLNGKTVEAHVRDPGRLKELLIPGRKVYIKPANGASRKTSYNLVLVRHGGILVSIDSTLPNRLIHKALLDKELRPFKEYHEVKKEVRYGRSRFDFLLTSDGKRCYVEVKSATLVMDGVAMFPDAVTARGARHIAELQSAREEGCEAFAVFVIQREDARRFTPQDHIDPAFGLALREAVKGGVRVLAYRCEVTLGEVRLAEEIEVSI